MATDQVWDAEVVPYELQGTTSIHANLALEPGVTVRMQPSTRVFVAEGGTWDLMGTTEAPVVLESASDNPIAGDWRQVTFDTSAAASVWTHATVRHGGGTGLGAVYVETDNRVSFDHVTFEDNLDCDVALATPTVMAPPATNSPYIACE